VLGVANAAHRVLVAVRDDNDVAARRPVPFTITDANPAGATGDDVKQDDAVTVGSEDLRGLAGGVGLVGPRLAILGAQEDRTFESQSLQRVLQHLRRQRVVRPGALIRYGGVAVMVNRRVRHES
jgi:hypothetical protein